MKSIKAKILTVVIAGLVVITAVVSMIAVDMTHEIMHKDADRILNNVALKEAAYLDDALGDISKSAYIMEHYALDQIQSLSQLEDLEFRADYLQRTKQMFIEIALNTKDVEGFYFRLNPEFTDNTTGYYVMMGKNNTMEDMQVTDLSRYPEGDEQNVSWYYTPVREGRAVWLEPYYFFGRTTQIVTYAIPVYVESKLLGVIGFDLDFARWVERIDKISVYEEGYAILLSSDDKIRYNNQDKEDGTNPVAKARVQLQNGMYLELRADYSDVQRDTRPMMYEIVYAFLAVLACAVVYTVFMTNRIVNPLKQLTVAAKKIADGEEYTPVETRSRDEVGTLTQMLTDTYGKIQEYNSYINALAYRDSLTGVKNTTAYAEAIKKINQEINCGNPLFGVLVVDINNLKRANDRYGHLVGDELIVHTAKALRETFKTSTVFRIGGDEFATILTGRDYDNYATALNRIDEACAESFVTTSDGEIPVLVARGVAIFDPSIDTVYKDVFKKADQAMYMHKEMSKTPAL